jgi:hypothetical protein
MYGSDVELTAQSYTSSANIDTALIRFSERRLTLKQLVDELKTRKVAQEWGQLDPSFAELPRVECEGVIINLILRYALGRSELMALFTCGSQRLPHQ